MSTGLHSKGTPLLNVAAAAGVPIFATDIVPTNGRSMLRYSFSSDTKTGLLLHVTEIEDPANTIAFDLTNGSDLAVSGCTTGAIDCCDSCSYNFSLVASGNVLYGLVSEVAGGVV